MPPDEAWDNVVVSSYSIACALKAAVVEDCTNVFCRNKLLKQFILPKNVEIWPTSCRRHLGITKCWAWRFISARLILCISRQAIYDSKVNQFLLTLIGFMNEHLNNQPTNLTSELISASVIYSLIILINIFLLYSKLIIIIEYNLFLLPVILQDLFKNFLNLLWDPLNI